MSRDASDYPEAIAPRSKPHLLQIVTSGRRLPARRIIRPTFMRRGPGSRSRCSAPGWRYALGVVAIPLFACTVASCVQGLAEPAAQSLTLLSGIAPVFSDDLSARLSSSVPHTNVKLQAAAGGVVVVSAVDKGKGDLGLAQSDVVYLAWRHGIERDRYPHTNLRGIAVLWFNNIYVLVRRNSQFHSIRDLKGKHVGVIPPGTSGEFAMRVVLGAYGMDYSDMKPTFHPQPMVLEGLARGEFDAVFVAYPLISPDVLELNQTVPLRLIGIKPEVTNLLRSRYPFLQRVLIPATQLMGQSSDVESVGAEWLLVCRSQLSEELVYELTKAFFAHLPDLASKHAMAAQIDPDQAPATPIPLHPGAARYYREREILK
jgi:uncharacterized protein